MTIGVFFDVGFMTIACLSTACHAPVFNFLSHSLPTNDITLIELLTVIAIIGILAAIIIPTVGKVRQNARIATSTSNLRQLGTAAQLFAAENRDTLPIYFFPNHPTHPNHGWMPALWRLIHGSRPMPGVPTNPDTTEQYRREWGNTVFYTPMMEEGTAVRAYGYNKYLCRFTGADPYSSNSTPLQVAEIANPARTAMIGDSRTSVQLRNDTNPTGRNNGKVLIVFVDGHVERLLPPDQASANPPPEERRMPYNIHSTFWRGVSSAPDGSSIATW